MKRRDEALGFGQLLANCAVVLMATIFLNACATKTMVDLGPGSVLGEGGLRRTKVVFAESPKLKLLGFDAQLSVTEAEKAALHKAIPQDFADVMAKCNGVFSRLEERADDLRWVAFGIATLGAISGGVVVPALTAANAAANAATIAAFGGVSGAVNAAQSTMGQQGLTAQETVKVRDQLRTEFNAGVKDYVEANDEGKKIRALEKLTAACIGYAIQSPTTVVKGAVQ